MLWKPTVLSLGHQLLVMLPEVDGVSSYNVITLLWRRPNWLLLKAVASLLGMDATRSQASAFQRSWELIAALFLIVQSFRLDSADEKNIFATDFRIFKKVHTKVRSGCIFIPDSLQIFKSNTCRNTLERIPVGFSYDLTSLLICPITQSMNDHNSFPSPALLCMCVVLQAPIIVIQLSSATHYSLPHADNQHIATQLTSWDSPLTALLL